LSCQFSPCVFPPTLLCSPPQPIHAGNLVLICPKHFLIPCSPVKSLPNFRELLRLFLFPFVQLFVFLQRPQTPRRLCAVSTGLCSGRNCAKPLDVRQSA